MKFQMNYYTVDMAELAYETIEHNCVLDIHVTNNNKLPVTYVLKVQSERKRKSCL